MTRFSFQRLDDGKSWGIKASGNIDQAHKYAGQTVEVRKADGSVQTVELGSMITAWNANRSAVYAIAGRSPSTTTRPAPVLRTPEQQEDDVDRADEMAEVEYDEMAADAYKWAAFYASPAGQLQKALDRERELNRLADSFPVSDEQFAEARDAIEAARALVAQEIAR